MIDKNNPPLKLPIPEELELTDLPKEVLRDLRGLEKSNAEQVGKYLLMSTILLEDNPEEALKYALAAKAKAGRIAVVRESVGVAAYRCADWSLALRELRTAMRISGNLEVLPLIADSLRALGKFDKVLELDSLADLQRISATDYVEFKIVMAAVWLDQHKPEFATTLLKKVVSKKLALSGVEKARLYFMYAKSLHAAGKSAEAETWYAKAVNLDSTLQAVDYREI